MRSLRALLLRLAGLLRRRQAEGEFAAEMESHLEMHIEDNLRAGMSTQEARRAAMMKLGGVEQTRELYRERRTLPWLETALRDVRFASRLLRNSPGFTLIAALTLALGIGANTAIFSIVDAVILRPLPYKDSARLVTVSLGTGMFPGMNLYLSWPAFEQIHRQTNALEQSAVSSRSEMTLTGQKEPLLVGVAGISNDFFEELGAAAEVGRLFSDADQKSGSSRVVVISDALWRAQFGTDASIVGRAITLDQQPYTVVGVARRGFAFPEDTQAWMPLRLTADVEQNQTYFNFNFVGKLKPQARVEQLNAELATIAARITKDSPEFKDGYTLKAESLLETRVKDSRAAYLMLLGAAAFVLLIACVNLSSLLLARGSARQRELAVRSALGASRARLVQQTLVESCLLAGIGGIFGALMAAWGVQAFRAIAPHGTPRLEEIAPDWTLLWFALGSSVSAGILLGIAPAWRAARSSPNESLVENSRSLAGAASVRRSRFAGTLVSAEVALAFVLLIGAALMIQTLANLLHQSPGFRTDHLLTFDLPGRSPWEQLNRDAWIEAEIARAKDVQEQIRRIPGIADVAASNHGILNGMIFSNGGLRIEGSIKSTASATDFVASQYVSPSYFRTLGISLVRGREFTEFDQHKAPRVAVVNETMARRYWGTLDVLGKHVSVSTDDQGRPVWDEVVGVIADTRDVVIGSPPPAELYFSLYQMQSGALTMIVRTTADPDALATAVSRAIWARYPDQPITHLATMTRTISESIGDTRMHTILLGVFAGIGLALALLGVYGVISYSVAQRTREIGVRVALGAAPADVLGMVLRQALLLILLGAAIGVAGALGLTRFIASELYGVKRSDPLTFAAAVAAIVIVGALACWIPARRAMRVDPMVALRHE